MPPKKPVQHKCGGCGAIVAGDQMIECERCLKWLCKNCSTLDDTSLDFFGQHKIMHWYCPPCNAPAMKAVTSDNLIEQRCKAYYDSFKEEVLQMINTNVGQVKASLETTENKLRNEQKDQNDKLTKLNDDLVKRMDKLDQGPNSLETKFEELNSKLNKEPKDLDKYLKEKIQEATEDSVKEMSDRENRKCNIILFNVKESEHVDTENRKKDDAEATRGILRKMNVDTPLSKPTRLGQGTKPRPLRVTLPSQGDVMKVMKEAAKMRDKEDLKDIFINRDLTPLERTNLKKLLEEKKRRNKIAEEAGEDTSWTIRGNKLVKMPQKKAQATGGV